jgi:hypothetical protein
MPLTEQKQSAETQSARRDPKQRALSVDALNDVIGPEHRWLSPKKLAELFDLDEKWLEDARGGRKEVDGPPFQKIGSAANAPVRYNLALALEWMRRFPTVVNTSGKSLSRFASMGDFLRERSLTEPWPFGWHNGNLMDVVELINRGLLDDDAVSLAWLTWPEWVASAANDSRLGQQLRVALDQVADHALALYESSLFGAKLNDETPTPDAPEARSGAL